mmetsp:Transcript_44354/g.87606  ORF Transcript_44354/g.87606 Transcript_44354/m.87606 type:complete len:92 (+) Transcript_44354:287-562(+)
MVFISFERTSLHGKRKHAGTHCVRMSVLGHAGWMGSWMFVWQLAFVCCVVRFVAFVCHEPDQQKRDKHGGSDCVKKAGDEHVPGRLLSFSW